MQLYDTGNTMRKDIKWPKAGQGGVGQRALYIPAPALQVNCVWAGSGATGNQVCTAGQTLHQPSSQVLTQPAGIGVCPLLSDFEREQ